MRILLGHPGLRGDLALNVPTIHHVHEQTGTEIDMPIHKQFADMLPLFVNQPAFTPVILDGYVDFPTERDNDLVRARRYDHVFNPMQTHVHDRWFDHQHQTATVLFDYFRQILPPEREQIYLHRWFEVDSRPDYVAFAPFAGWSHERTSDKMLSVERAQAIVDSVLKLGRKVLQIGGPGEPELVGAEVFKGTYFESVKAVLSCRLLLHTDTGMGWIISGYQHPQLGLYGHRYYGKERVGNIQPRNPNGLYLDAGTVNDISLDTIANAIRLVID